MKVMGGGCPSMVELLHTILHHYAVTVLEIPCTLHLGQAVVYLQAPGHLVCAVPHNPAD